VSDKKTLVEMLNRNRLFDGFTKKDVLALIDYSKDVAHPKGSGSSSRVVKGWFRHAASYMGGLVPWLHLLRAGRPAG
jgi:hypothetical protein